MTLQETQMPRPKMTAIAAVVIVLVAFVAFFVGMQVGKSSIDVSPASTSTVAEPSILMMHDTRPIVELADGEPGTLENWRVTASYESTDGEYGYGKRRLWFEVRIEWTGDSGPGEFMYENFLQRGMLFTSPSGKAANVNLRGYDSNNSDYDATAPYSGQAYNGSDSLPDESGTFYLTFGPHPNKHRLVWSVDLPHLPLNNSTE